MELEIISLEFTLVAVDTIKLPKHPGSTLRGAFGHGLRQIACSIDDGECKQCDLNSNCAYSLLFSPFLVGKERLETSERFKNKPRPFVFEPLTSGKEIFKPGDSIKFRLNLFGYVGQFLPYITKTWKHLEEEGIGVGRGKFKLSEIWNSNILAGKAERVYSEYADEVCKSELRINNKDVQQLQENLSDDQIQLKLLTPMLLKYEGSNVNSIKFYILMRNLFRRLSSLSAFYGNEKLDIDFDTYLNQARKVKLIKENIDWQSWNRYSSRQNQKIKMKGLVGELEYQGEIADFLPYLILGQYTHIGKNTVFGLGNFKILK